MTKRFLAAWHAAFHDHRNLTVIAICSAAMALAAVIVPAPRLIEITLGMAIGAMSAVAASHAPDALRAIRNGLREDWELLICGQFLFVLSLDLLAVWGLSYRLLGQPAWMTDSVVIAILRFVVILGAWMIMFAPRTKEGKVPEGTWGWIIAFVAGAITMAVLGTPHIPTVN